MLRCIIKPSLVPWVLGLGFSAASLSTLPSALAGEVQVNGGDCAPVVHLLARDAPLSDVLKQLAKSLDFGLSFESDSDPLVNIDAVRPPIDLLVPLAPLKNVVIERATNPRCPQRERIVKVWVLPDGQGSVMRTTMAAPDVLKSQDIEEKTRRAQAGIDMILNAHGIPTAAEGKTLPQ